MSSARGAAGAIKPKLHNVNSIYAGKNHNAVKAPGTGKHGGLQSLGKTTPAVRRMPPAVTLPSLRAESQGQDPNVNLVPQGGVGWHKENTSANGSSSETSSSLKSGGNAIGSSSGAVGVPSTGPGTHATDLRPTWAKQPSAVETRAAAAQSAIAVAASARDFPSLAAATAVTGKQSSASLTDSLKPQKSGSWRAGGSSALSKNEGDEPSSPPQIHPIGGSGYSGSSTPSRPVERQLPSRYYDGSVAPPPIPSGTYQVPNLQRSSTPPVAAQRSMEKPESRNMSQGNAAVGNVTSAAVPQTAPAVLPFPANVAVPPPNYSQPPPNFHPVQDQMRNASMLYPTPVAVGKCSSEVIQDVQNEEGAQQLQKNGLGDGGYVTECAQKPNFSESIASQNVGNGTQQGMRPIRSSDVRTTGFRRTESFDNRAWRDNDRGPTIGGMQHRYRDIPFEDSSLRSGEAEWQSTQYGYMDREAESRRWRNAGGGGRDVQRSPIDGSMNSYSRGHEDDVGRRENVEREAAIERSRQKKTDRQPDISAIGKRRKQSSFDLRISSYTWSI